MRRQPSGRFVNETHLGDIAEKHVQETHLSFAAPLRIIGYRMAMCGICGTYGVNDQAFLCEMCSLMEHRGPDSRGTFSDGDVMLGVTRLSIIDLASGDQPIHNEDSTIWIVFNGEFYNYKPWMSRLKELGHSFYTRSDTETMLHLYEEFGPDCLGKIRGMFALAIWDSKKKTLFLARDRFGVKPLYYYKKNGLFIFASEMKAFIKRIPRTFDYAAVPFYLSLRYLPGEMTMIKEVKKLPASSYALVKEEGLRLVRYYTPPSDTMKPLGDPAEMVKRLLSESIALRLVSDVPLGVFLSGGLDSSAIVGLMKQLRYEKISTFSVGFNDEFDELSAAQEVASLFETDHHEITVDERETIKALPDVVYHLDEPLADPASIPTFFLAKEAHKTVKGVLLGEGADEVFGGYEHYRFLKMIETADSVRTRRIFAGLTRIAPSVVANRFLKYSALLGEEGRRRAERALNGKSVTQTCLELVSIYDQGELDSMIGPLAGDKVLAYANSSFKSKDHVRDFQLFDTQNFLQHLLTRADKMTMAHSVEAREPFLDYPLVEYSLSLSTKYKVGLFQDKKILRKALKDTLPQEIARRRKKRFFVPIQQWFTSELEEYFWEKMDQPNLGIFDRKYLERFRSRYGKSPLYFARQMWSILSLELWYETFFADLEIRKPLQIEVAAS